MTFLEYQQEAIKTRVGSADNEEYLTLGLLAEVGEVADKLAKRKRDGVFDVRAFIKELGDVLWFVANLADYWDKNGDPIEYPDDISEELEAGWGRHSDGFGDDVSNTKVLAFWASAVVFDEVVAADGLYQIVARLVALGKLYGYTLEQVAEINIAKLRDRQARGVLQGDGDKR